MRVRGFSNKSALDAVSKSSGTEEQVARIERYRNGTLRHTLPIALSLSLLFGVRIAGAERLARLKRVVDFDGESRYRLFVHGRRTPVSITKNSSTVAGPSVLAHRTRKGIVYGTVGSVSSGAVTVSYEIAFVLDQHRFLSKNGYAAEVHRGETVLLVPVQGGPWIEAGHAQLYRAGRLIDLGPSQSAGFGKGGSVVGWYYSKEDGSAYTGLSGDMYGPVYKQYFEYTNGSRKLKGRQQIQ